MLRPWLIGALLLLSSASAAAGPAALGRQGRVQRAAAQGLIEKGRAALQEKELTGARRALEQAYRIAALPEVLFLLGRLAEADRRILDAHDLMRRFLIDPARMPDDAAMTEAQRVVQLARPPSGQIAVLGEPGSLISIDDRLVGSVPLAQPLLVSPGEHRITLQLGSRRLESPVAVQAGRSFEVRFTQQSGAVLITLLPAVLWVTEQVGVPEEAQNPLADAAEQAARAADQTLLTAEAALARAPELKSCLGTIECRQNLARKNEVEYVLSLRAVQKVPAASGDQPGKAHHADQPDKPTPPPSPKPSAAPPLGSWQLTLALWHAELSTPAATGTAECAGCSAEQAASALKKATTKLLAEGLRRGHGSYTVTSEPPAAELRLGGKAIGVTPYRQAAWTGTYELELHTQGYEPAQRTLEVRDGQVAEVAVALTPLIGVEPAPAALKPRPTGPARRRPIWRLATGASLTGTGALFLGIGLVAAAQGNPCMVQLASSTFCTSYYNTDVIAQGLISTGAILGIAGVVLLALPPPRPAAAAAAR